VLKRKLKSKSKHDQNSTGCVYNFAKFSENKNPRGLMIAASFCFCSSIITAQTKPDFSGVWKMNREKSKFPAFPAMENIHDVVSKIEHKEPNFSESMTITGVDGDGLLK
jgi:hypothetical protein